MYHKIAQKFRIEMIDIKVKSVMRALAIVSIFFDTEINHFI